MTMEVGFFILAILGACGTLWAYLESRIKQEVKGSQADRSRLFERDEALRAEINTLRAEMLNRQAEISAKFVEKEMFMRIEERLTNSVNHLSREVTRLRALLSRRFKDNGE